MALLFAGPSALLLINISVQIENCQLGRYRSWILWVLQSLLLGRSCVLASSSHEHVCISNACVLRELSGVS